MRKHILLFALSLLMAPAIWSQTIIDLQRGNVGIRSKNLHDYEQPQHSYDKLRRDSLAYVDCLTRGFNFLHADSIVAARQCFERALKLRPSAPGNYVVRRQLGLIHMAESKYSEAIEDFNYILSLHPTEFDDRLNRASCYLSQELPQQALDDCQVLLQHALDTASTVRTLFVQAFAHKQLRQYHQVSTDLLRILSMKPTLSSAQLLYAINLADMGQPKEALNQLSLYISVHPRDAEALLARAQLFYKQRNLIQAREDINEALEASPNDPELLLFRAKIVGEMGQKQPKSRIH